MIATILFIFPLSLLEVLLQHSMGLSLSFCTIMYASTGQGKTIHSSAQLEWYKNDVNDKSMKAAGGLQHILNNDGYVIPINMREACHMSHHAFILMRNRRSCPISSLQVMLIGIQVSLTMILMNMRPVLMPFLTSPVHHLIPCLMNWVILQASGCPRALS